MYSDGSVLHVIDDDFQVRNRIKAIAESLQYDVIVSDESSRLEGLLKFATPLCYLINIKPNNNQGLDTIQALLKSTQARPIIAMSAFNDINTALQAMSYGASNILLKPFTRAQFIEQIKQLPINK